MEKQELYSLLKEKSRRNSRRKLFTYFPDEGPLRRELYAKHLQFFAAGKMHRERCMLAANRVGKTESLGGYEAVLHLTGLYPYWWPGRRFDRPVDGWAAGDTGKTVRDIIQRKLFGPHESIGTGLIPGDDILSHSPWVGVPDAFESVKVRHVSGGVSTLQFKSYDQGREVFQGTEKDFIWLDEEPPLSIYTESLLRLMTTNGMMLATFTPLEGLSETVMHFLPDGQIQERQQGPRFLIMATWDDVPHLSESVKTELLQSIPPYQRDARSKGIPQLGSGAIYPVPESEFLIAPIEIPDHWPRCYALDVGWARTAALWIAHDRQAQTIYAYAEHYRAQAEPAIHAAAIRARGEWIKGVVDPAARGRSQRDGEQLIQNYRDLGLSLQEADNAVEAGLQNVWERLSGGRLKVFNTLPNFMSEYRLYRRDEKGRIVKERDHLMDCLRYACMSGLRVATTKAANTVKLTYESVPA